MGRKNIPQNIYFIIVNVKYSFLFKLLKIHPVKFFSTNVPPSHNCQISVYCILSVEAIVYMRVMHLMNSYIHACMTHLTLSLHPYPLIMCLFIPCRLEMELYHRGTYTTWTTYLKIDYFPQIKTLNEYLSSFLTGHTLFSSSKHVILTILWMHSSSEVTVLHIYL